MNSLLIGFGLGVFVAAQPGPISLLTIRTSARRWRSGLAIGAGAASIDLVYALLGAAGAAPFLQSEPLRIGFGLLGGAFLAVLGTRTLWSAWRAREGMELVDEVSSTRRSYVTGLAATASNPLTIVAWAAIFAAANVAGAAASMGGALLLVGAVGLGSLAWFALLSSAARMIMRRTGDRMLRVLDVLSGVGLVGLGAALGVRTVAQIAD